MPEFSLPLPTEPSRAPVTRPVHRATALLQEALHDSRRATFTQEFGEIRGIHRLSAPPAAEVFVDSNASVDFAPPPANLAFVDAYLGRSAGADRQTVAEPEQGGELKDGEPPSVAYDRGTNSGLGQAADPQLRGLIRDFRERQRKAGLIVAGSVASAATLTVMTIALVIALAT